MMILRVAIVVGLVLLGSLTVMWLCCCCSRMVNRFMNTMCLLGVWLGIAVAIAALAMIVQFSQGIVVALGTEDGTAPTADASTIGLVLRELIKWTTSNGFTKPTLQWLAHMYSVYVPH